MKIVVAFSHFNKRYFECDSIAIEKYTIIKSYVHISMRELIAAIKGKKEKRDLNSVHRFDCQIGAVWCSDHTNTHYFLSLAKQFDWCHSSDTQSLQITTY